MAAAAAVVVVVGTVSDKTGEGEGRMGVSGDVVMLGTEYD